MHAALDVLQVRELSSKIRVCLDEGIPSCVVAIYSFHPVRSCCLSDEECIDYWPHMHILNRKTSIYHSKNGRSIGGLIVDVQYMTFHRTSRVVQPFNFTDEYHGILYGTPVVG